MLTILCNTVEITGQVPKNKTCLPSCQVFYDEYVTLPTTEGGWKAELDAFLKDRGFPCVGAWDCFHVYISSNLKKFFNFKNRYSVTIRN